MGEAVEVGVEAMGASTASSGRARSQSFLPAFLGLADGVDAGEEEGEERDLRPP